LAERARRRGRPTGGGADPFELREAFLDAAERSVIARGHMASTMDVIAREAGYSRGTIYRTFPTRESLVDALAQRTTQRHFTQILARLPDGADPIALLVEAMVIVATELNQDPLLRKIADQDGEHTIAFKLANNDNLLLMAETWIAAMIEQDRTDTFKPGLRPKDLSRYLIATSIAMLLGVIPGIENPDTARRYINVFILPAIITNPPAAGEVFT
jgi:AcrR family transcriptional regulator